MAYQSRMLELIERILDILGLGLPKEWGCPPDIFNSLLEKPSIPMRFLHYGPVQTRDPRQFGGESAGGSAAGLRMRVRANSDILLPSGRPHRLRVRVYHPPGAWHHWPRGVLSAVADVGLRSGG